MFCTCDLLLNRRMATWNLVVKYFDWANFCDKYKFPSDCVTSQVAAIDSCRVGQNLAKLFILYLNYLCHIQILNFIN